MRCEPQSVSRSAQGERLELPSRELDPLLARRRQSVRGLYLSFRPPLGLEGRVPVQSMT